MIELGDSLVVESILLEFCSLFHDKNKTINTRIIGEFFAEVFICGI